jgi:uncharacterized protein YraI
MRERAKVLPGDGLRLRAAPSTNAQVLETIPTAAKVTLTGARQNGFVAVEHGNQAGWAFSTYLATDAGKVVGPIDRVTADDGLNLRGEPSTDAHILQLMPAGTLVARTGGNQNGFQAVSHDGVAGWAFAEYLDDVTKMIPHHDPGLGPGGDEWNAVNQWSAEIEAATSATGVPANLIRAVMRLESNGDPSAPGGAGVVGLMQINTSPDAWGHGPWDDDNAGNVLKGAQILKWYYDNNGSDWYEALRHYHGVGWDGYTTDIQYADIVTGHWNELGG